MTNPPTDPRWWRSPDGEWVRCEVCERRAAVMVRSVPGIPYSAAYCDDCHAANAHPYWLVVRHTALIGGMGDAASWWQDIVRNTLTHLNKPRGKFERDVTSDMLELDGLET